jgi:DNA-binding MarR family transcriptional regulator
MPFPTSPISHEIIYLVAARGVDEPLSVKELYLELGYSEARVSDLLRQLVEAGWIISTQCLRDKRIRRLYPSDRLKALLVQAASKI